MSINHGFWKERKKLVGRNRRERNKTVSTQAIL